MIPKKIHYCWFGGNPLPELAQKCIASWQKFCPDYEIIQWNEENFDIEAVPYVKQAYEAKKWAFVSDYARFKILYEEGGFYLDTDVELLKPLDDLLETGGFMASESRDCEVATGLGIGAEKGLPVYQEILEDYHRSSFLQEDGSYDMTTVVKRITRILEGHGLKRVDKIQKVAGIVIYTKEYFCPMDYYTRKIRCTKNTYSIHHYADSWNDRPISFKGKIYRMIYRVFGERVALLIKKMMSK